MASRIFRTILNYAYIVCSTDSYLHEEIEFIEPTFWKISNYLKCVINQLTHEIKHVQTQHKNNVVSSINGTETGQHHLLVLPYALLFKLGQT